MSAIWGMISFNNSIDRDVDCLMRSYYRENCKVDNILEYKETEVYMACGMQYITKESKNEVLPFRDYHKNIGYTADCILDNRQELINELGIGNEGYADGRLMYEAYLKWGIDCVKHFRGIFALAIYDYGEKSLYLVSDPVSARCLYYHANDEHVIFSTLLNPIIKVYPSININELYIKDFLVAPGLMPNIVSHETPYENVYKMNPGTYVKISVGKIEEVQYWDPSEPLEEYKCRTAKECGESFYKLYSECVKDAM